MEEVAKWNMKIKIAQYEEEKNCSGDAGQMLYYIKATSECHWAAPR